MRKSLFFVAGAVLCVAILASSNANAQIGPNGPPPPNTGSPVKRPTLSWDLPPTGIQTNAYRGIVSGGPYGKLNSTPIPGNTYTDATTTPGVQNFYIVTAVRTADGAESAWSNQVSATVPANPSPHTGFGVVLAVFVKIGKVVYAGLKAFVGIFG